MLYLYVQCPRNPEEVSDALKLEIQEVMGHLVGPGNQTLVLCKSSTISVTDINCDKTV